MVDDWSLRKISDITLTNTDTYSPKEGWKYVNYLDTGNITEGSVASIQMIVDGEKLPSRARRKIKAGDIVYSTVRPNQKHYGIIASPLENMLVSTGFTVIRGKDNQCDTKFLYYFLTQSDIIESLQTIAEHSTSTYPSIRPVDIENLNINLPPLPEQKAIAHILGSLDDKIELNQRMNKTLEAIAKAIFKSWFIDFDPVRGKMERRQPEGMSKEVADLFCDSFVDSELGMIPKGWEVKSLPEVMEINPKRSLSKGIKAPYLDMKNMPTQGHRPEFWIEREFNSGVKFINGDTLMARITPCLENGKTAFVDFLEDGQTAWGSTEYIVFRPKHPLPFEFGYYLVRSEDFKAFSILNMTGSSGRQRTPVTCFNQYLIVVCPEEIAIKFGESVKRLMKMIASYSNQSRTLANVRDSLLPKLISGEIRVKEAEKTIEEVL